MLGVYFVSLCLVLGLLVDDEVTEDFKEGLILELSDKLISSVGAFAFEILFDESRELFKFCFRRLGLTILFYFDLFSMIMQLFKIFRLFYLLLAR